MPVGRVFAGTCGEIIRGDFKSKAGFHSAHYEIFVFLVVRKDLPLGSRREEHEVHKQSIK
jgi:hypothetical protein